MLYAPCASGLFHLFDVYIIDTLRVGGGGSFRLGYPTRTVYDAFISVVIGDPLHRRAIDDLHDHFI